MLTVWNRKLECELYHVKYLLLPFSKRKLWDIFFSIIIATYVWDEFTSERIFNFNIMSENTMF